MCFSYESQEFYLAFLCKAIPVSARLNLTSALLDMLLHGDGKKVAPKALSLKCMLPCVCFRQKEEMAFSATDNLNVLAFRKSVLLLFWFFFFFSLRALAALEPKTDLKKCVAHLTGSMRQVLLSVSGERKPKSKEG